MNALDEHTVLWRYRGGTSPTRRSRSSSTSGERIPDSRGRQPRRPGPRPRLRERAATLATLHRRLHTIAAPEWLPAIGPGDAVVHLDLHPENVLLGTRGPQVIDWANARRGHWADDVAQTEGFDRDAVREHLDAAIARRVADPSLKRAERDAARALRVEPR